ncbi:hypothetical protein JOF53_002987 [Crossiella equi]|uniref:DUF4282 domain-containing protein n=1 Tax=Crossiella equi TaxID=130796 RepID=A0ABS5AEI8_9PSEU|nr:hypothetical protein [Crossiella equi]MBP2474115.1 hypothetical protein [Crossiella equi]
MQWLVDSWDALGLWLAQLWFPFQFLLVMAVLLPLCWGVAWLIDRGVDQVSAGLSKVRERNGDLS